MEIGINAFLQQFSNPFLDKLALAITALGDEMFFILVAVAIFWCVDKKFGFRIINVYLISAATMAGMKQIFRRPRPFETGEVKSIGAKSSGYSFPSGHSHSAASLTTQSALKSRKSWVIIAGALFTALVMLSRVYLGQHYLSDVLAGCSLGIILGIMLTFLYGFIEKYDDKICLVISPLCLVIAIILAALKVESGQVYDVLGGYGAATLAYTLEKSYVRLNVRCEWWKQITKIIVGAVIVLAVKEGLKYLLIAVNFTHPLAYSFFRYALVAFSALLIAPFVFKKCGLNGKDENMRFAQKQPLAK